MLRVDTWFATDREEPMGRISAAEGKHMNRYLPNLLLLTFVLSILLLPLDSYAYIDPNTGGWLFQLLFPVLVAIGIAWNFLKTKIRAFLGWISRRSE